MIGCLGPPVPRRGDAESVPGPRRRTALEAHRPDRIARTPPDPL